MYYTKEELVGVFEAAGLSIPTMEVDPKYYLGWKLTWHVDDLVRFEKADEIKEALSKGPLRFYKVYRTIGQVIIYVD